MAETERTVVLTVRGRAEGIDEAKRKFSELGVTYEQIDRLEKQRETTLERLARSNNALFAVEQRRAEQEARIERAYRSAIDTGQDAARAEELRATALTGLSEKTDAAIQRITNSSSAAKAAAIAARDHAAAVGLVDSALAKRAAEEDRYIAGLWREVEAQQALIAAERERQVAESAQSQYNDILGVRPAQAGTAAASAAVFREAAEAQERQAAAAQMYADRLNPLLPLQRAYQAQLLEINQLHAAGLLTEQQRTASLAQVGAAFHRQSEMIERAGSSAGLAGHQYANLTFQINDVVSGILMGQPAFMILAQQGGQFVQIFGGVRETFEGLPRVVGNFVRAIPPVVGVVGGVVAAAYGLYEAWSAHNESVDAVERAYRKVGGVAGVTKGELEALAQSTAEATGQSVRSVRAIQAELINTGLSGELFRTALPGLRDFAARIGEDVPTAAKKLTDAVKGGADGIRDLDRGYNLLTVQQLRTIQTMTESGRLMEAQRYAVDAINVATKGAADEGMSAFEAGWNRIAAALSNAGDKLGALLNDLQKPITLGEWEKRLNELNQNGRWFFEGSQREFLQGKVRELTPEQFYQDDIFGAEQGAAQERAAGKQREALDRFFKPYEDAIARASLPPAERGRLEAGQRAVDNLQRSGLEFAPADLERARRLAEQGYAEKEAARRRQQDADRAGNRGESQARRTEQTLTELAGRAAAAERLANAMQGGAEATRRAEVEAAAWNVAIKAGVEGSDEFERAYGRALELLDREAVAKSAQELVKWRIEIDESNAATRRLIDAESQGATAVREATIANEALAQARRLGLEPTDENIGKLAEEIRLQKELNASLVSAQRLRSLQSDISRARGERGLIGRSGRERAVGQAMLDEQALLDREGITGDEAAKRLRAARDLASVRYENEKLQESYDYLGDFGERAFDRIGSSITEMSLKGEDAFDSLRNVGRAVFSELAQEALKLGTINPLKNMLFGQDNPTLSSVFGMIGGLAGGGGWPSGMSPLPGPSGAPGGVLGGGFALGGAFEPGGIVNRPTVFPMAKGMGLMGEAGPEAVMPLARSPSGHLGVRALSSPGRSSSSGPTSLQVNVTVNGARGDREIRDMTYEAAYAAANAALAQREETIVRRSIQAVKSDQRRG